MNPEGLYEGACVQVTSVGKEGVITKLIGAKAEVIVGEVKLFINTANLQLVYRRSLALKKETFPKDPSISARPRILNPSKNDPLRSFCTSLDLHGLYLDEAMTILDKFIDRSILLGCIHVQIIHGKGEGTLRKMVRNYLTTSKHIKQILNKYPYISDGGTTWAELH